jgi:hypothetical protein
VRDEPEQEQMAGAQALKAGMEQKAREFVEKGAEVYAMT